MYISIISCAIPSTINTKKFLGIEFRANSFVRSHDVSFQVFSCRAVLRSTTYAPSREKTCLVNILNILSSLSS